MIPNQIEAQGTYWAKIIRIEDKLIEIDSAIFRIFLVCSFILLSNLFNFNTIGRNKENT